MEILIAKISETTNSTLSAMSVEGKFICFILEDGYRETKVPGETRIPAGRYPVVARTHGKFYEKYKKQFGHKFVPQIWDVPQFSDILMHIGNKVKDTRGCTLTGMQALYDAHPFVPVFELRDSTTAYKILYSCLEAAFDKKENVYITIDRT